MWQRQVSTNGYTDTIFHDGVDTDTTIETTAVLKSLPGVKPISGQYKAMNKFNMENCALRKSPNWHLDTIQSVSANQLLMAVELGTFNTQNAIGNGVVSNDSSEYINCASLTGSTSSLGDTTGMADETIYDVAGTGTPFNTNGKVSVSYRGMENPWGNIWKHVNGINIWGNGSMKGGQAYICSNYSFNESDHGENYEPVGFTISNISTWVSAFGYGSEKYDWLFLPSETGTNNANSGAPVGDHFSCISDLNGYCSAAFGGRWVNNLLPGGFYWALGNRNDYNHHTVGGRLLFVPTVTA